MLARNLMSVVVGQHGANWPAWRLAGCPQGISRSLAIGPQCRASAGASPTIAATAPLDAAPLASCGIAG